MGEEEDAGSSAGAVAEDDDAEAGGGGVGVVEEDGKRRFVGNVSKENELGRRKRYGVYLPLPGHVGGPTKANVWDAEDVSVRGYRGCLFLPEYPSCLPL